MSELINAKPRFGLEGDRLYDYVAGRYITLTGGLKIEGEGGEWDAMQVADCIRKGVSIESAFTPHQVVSPEVHQANQDFLDTLHTELDKALASGPTAPAK